MKATEVIEWLQKCGRCTTDGCETCPYDRDPYEEGCGKLLTDAAALMAVFVPGETTVEEYV